MVDMDVERSERNLNAEQPRKCACYLRALAAVETTETAPR